MNADVAHQESGITSPSNRFVSVVAADRTSSDNTNLSSNGVSTFHAPLVNKKKKNGVILPPPTARPNRIGMFFELLMVENIKRTII